MSQLEGTCIARDIGYTYCRRERTDHEFVFVDAGHALDHYEHGKPPLRACATCCALARPSVLAARGLP